MKRGRSCRFSSPLVHCWEAVVADEEADITQSLQGLFIAMMQKLLVRAAKVHRRNYRTSFTSR